MLLVDYGLSTGNHAIDSLVVIALALAAVRGGVAAVSSMVKHIRKADREWSLMTGAPKEVAQLAAALATLEERTRELKPNGGSSMRDQITKISVDLARLGERTETISRSADASARELARGLLDVQRAVNALRAEYDVHNEIARGDKTDLWDAIKELGGDRREHDRPPTG